MTVFIRLSPRETAPAERTAHRRSGSFTSGHAHHHHIALVQTLNHLRHKTVADAELDRIRFQIRRGRLGEINRHCVDHPRRTALARLPIAAAPASAPLTTPALTAAPFTA